MKHISSVLIENFQSHSLTEIALSPGLNVIVGPSDNGKSAILRAIRWCLYNVPRGTDFVRTGARECRVTVYMNDGAAITREVLLSRTGGSPRNRYLVTKPGQDDQVFEGFADKIPAEVIQAHGMPEVKLDTDKSVTLNFGTQLEGPFLLGETGSFGAKAIGRLLGVHVIDAARRATSADHRAAKADMTKSGAEVDRLAQALEPYKNLPELEAQLNQAQAKMAHVTTLQNRLRRLQTVRDDLTAIAVQVSATAMTLDRLAGIETARAQVAITSEKQTKVANLVRINGALINANAGISTSSGTLDRLAVIPGLTTRFNQSLSQLGEVEHLKWVRDEIGTCAAEIDRLQVQVVRLRAGSDAGELLAQVAGLKCAQLSTSIRIRTALQAANAEAARLEISHGRLNQAVAAQTRLSTLVAAQTRMDQLRAKRVALADVKERLTKGARVTTENQAALDHHFAEFGRVLKAQGTCPTCGQPVTTEIITGIVTELTHAHKGGLSA